MKKIENRAVVCFLLALLLAAGMALFLFRYFTRGGSWASSAFNRHLYNSSGQLSTGTVLDRDGDILSSVEDGKRTYYENETVRKATLHAVGDLQGNIGTGALNAFANKLTGWNFLNGAFGADLGGELTLTLDARYNYEAYQALNGKAGAVAVYNYKTGDVLCMVSSPAYDPLHVPEGIETEDRYKGAYLNRFLSSVFTPRLGLQDRYAGGGPGEHPRRGNADLGLFRVASVGRRDHCLFRCTRGTGAGCRFRQQLQRCLRPDGHGTGGFRPPPLYGTGGLDGQLFTQRDSYCPRVL